MTTLPVIEIFKSIQGEGLHMGKVVTFVRLAGCNLRCPWCDTKESWNENANEMSIEDIVSKIDCPNVVITGGEPTIHEGLDKLAATLRQKGYHTAIETNGTNRVPWYFDWVTASPKPPKYTLYSQLEAYADELKYVVTDDFDVDQAIPERIRMEHADRIWLQPDGSDPQTMQRMWKKCFELAQLDPRLRVGVQLHKIMEVQ